MSTDTYPLVSSDPEVQYAYELMRDNGQSHNMAEMLATKTFPAAKSDTRFAARMKRDQHLPNKYYRMAKKAGVITNDKQYVSQLANFPGDPKAWVGGDARSEIARRCKKNGWGCDGAIDIKAATPEIPDDEPYKVDDKLVHKAVGQLATLDPGAVSTPKKLERTVNDTRERLTGDGPW